MVSARHQQSEDRRDGCLGGGRGVTRLGRGNFHLQPGAALKPRQMGWC